MNLEPLSKDQLRRMVEVLLGRAWVRLPGGLQGKGISMIDFDERMDSIRERREEMYLGDRDDDDRDVVSHSPEVQELCDERIEVGRG